MLKQLACAIGWHSYFVGYEQLPDNVSHPGYGRHRCRWCGGVGLVDSQGNLFDVGKPD